MRRLSRVTATCVVVFLCAAAFGAPIYIKGVPDWDQPVIAGPPPNLGGGWDAWCVPTAAADIMGYYRDKGLSSLIADGLVFPNKNAWGVAPNKTKNYQDDTADPGTSDPPTPVPQRGDIGWYMNTNDFGQTGGAVAHVGTYFNDIKPGLDGIRPAVPGWRGYFPDHAQPVNVQNAANNASGMNTVPGGPFSVTGIGFPSVWPRIMAEIDGGRPMIGSFYWFPAVNSYVKVLGTGLGDLDNYEKAVWPTSNPGGDCTTGEQWDGQDLGHAVPIVGYWLGTDPTNPFWVPGVGAPNAIIVHDSRDGYQANGKPWPLVLPFDLTCPWVMNTEITLIPEPATLALLAVGAGTLSVLRRRRRQ